jgi:phage gp29-like protein
MFSRLRALFGDNQPEAGQLVERRVIQYAAGDRTGAFSQELTPERIERALRGASGGSLGELQDIYTKMQATDAHVQACMKSVKSALASYPIRVAESKTRNEASRAAAEMAQDMIARLNHNKLVRQMANAHFSGVRIFENMFDLVETERGPQVFLADLKLVPPARYKFETEDGNPRYGMLMIVTEDEQEGKHLDKFPYGKLLVVEDGEHEDGFYDLAGAGRSCLFWYLAKNMSSQWWAEFNELYGQPLRIGYHDETMSESERDDMARYMRNLSRASWAIFPEHSDVQFVEMNKNGTVKTYNDLIGLGNNEISKAIVGQIGTMGRDKYGSYGEAGVLNTVRFEIIMSNAEMIETALQQAILHCAQMNLDPAFDPADLPRCYLPIPNPEEKIKKAELFDRARRFIRIPMAYVHDELGIPTADASEEVIPGFGAENGAAEGGSGQNGSREESDGGQTTRDSDDSQREED